MRKLLYILAAVTGVGLMLSAVRRAQANDIYEESRQMRLRRIHSQPPNVWEY
jgi:hypothetical protein